MKRVDLGLNVIAISATLAQTKESFQIASLVLTCISVAISIAYTVYKWYKKASADGKITADEIKEGIEQIKEEIKK